MGGALAIAGRLGEAVRGDTKPPAIVTLGSRRELLIDDLLIDSHLGADFRLHKPQPRDVAITCDAAWEGNTSAYFTIFQDGERYRMYYRGSHYDEASRRGTHPEYVCYAESRDGVHFTKPSLGLFEHAGSKANNIVWPGPEGAHNFSPFLDTNPACPPEARYKALGRDVALVNAKKKSSLFAFQSGDGLNWQRVGEQPVITDGAFDSQNIAFWDSESGEYRAYWRYFDRQPSVDGKKIEGVRAIRTATSKDFIRWDNQQDLEYAGAPREHLYTNAIQPYARAPHLLLGFPTRFQPKTEQVEPVFMSSRDRIHFRRWPEELIPITAPQDRDGNRANYMCHGLVQLPGDERELSVYATEAYYRGPGSRVRRFVFRLDGFVSLQAKAAATIVTKPLVFSGSELRLNLVSRGPSRVELLDVAGQPLFGFAADDCQPIHGDFIDHRVVWRGGRLQAWAGKPVRLRLNLDQADLYALQFSQTGG
jgi:hypothetical protein